MIPILLGSLVGVMVLYSIACAALKIRFAEYIPGFVIVFLLALVAFIAGEQVTFSKKWWLAAVLWHSSLGFLSVMS